MSDKCQACGCNVDESVGAFVDLISQMVCSDCWGEMSPFEQWIVRQTAKGMDIDESQRFWMRGHN